MDKACFSTFVTEDLLTEMPWEHIFRMAPIARQIAATTKLEYKVTRALIDQIVRDATSSIKSAERWYLVTYKLYPKEHMRASFLAKPDEHVAKFPSC